MDRSTRQPARLIKARWASSGRMVRQGSRRPDGRRAFAAVVTASELTPSRCTARLTASVLPGAARDRSPASKRATCALVEVDEEALAYEERGPGGVVPATVQDGGHVVGPEVGGRQGQTSPAPRWPGAASPCRPGCPGGQARKTVPRWSGTASPGRRSRRRTPRPGSSQPRSPRPPGRRRTGYGPDLRPERRGRRGPMPRQSDSWAPGSPSGLLGRFIPARTKATAWLVREGRTAAKVRSHPRKPPPDITISPPYPPGR